MKCFVHLGFQPEPHESDDPASAIAFAESFLHSIQEDRMTIRWRRDDLYPDNFVEYTVNDLAQHLQQRGEVSIQLTEIGPDGLPVMGEMARIFTEEKENRDIKEAQKALSIIGEEEKEEGDELSHPVKVKRTKNPSRRR